MFFGHIAVGLAAKPVAPKAPLGALLLSATAIDTLSGVFAIAGIETIDAAGNISIPWSHGLFMAVVWSIAGFGLAWVMLLFVFLLVVPSMVPQLNLLPVFATLLLLPLGNWVDRHRPLTVTASARRIMA